MSALSSPVPPTTTTVARPPTAPSDTCSSVKPATMTLLSGITFSTLPPMDKEPYAVQLRLLQVELQQFGNNCKYVCFECMRTLVVQLLKMICAVFFRVRV